MRRLGEANEGFEGEVSVGVEDGRPGRVGVEIQGSSSAGRDCGDIGGRVSGLRLTSGLISRVRVC